MGRGNHYRCVCRHGLGPLEVEAMSVLWSLGEGSVRQVMHGMPGKKAYTTVETTLGRLYTKGLLRRRELDRKFLYRPAIPLETWQQQAASNAVAEFLATPYASIDLLLSCLRETLARQDAETGLLRALSSHNAPAQLRPDRLDGSTSCTTEGELICLRSIIVP
jgi:predicted transcriptional regulator